MERQVLVVAGPAGPGGGVAERPDETVVDYAVVVDAVVVVVDAVDAVVGYASFHRILLPLEMVEASIDPLVACGDTGGAINIVVVMPGRELKVLVLLLWMGWKGSEDQSLFCMEREEEVEEPYSTTWRDVTGLCFDLSGHGDVKGSGGSGGVPGPSGSWASGLFGPVRFLVNPGPSPLSLVFHVDLLGPVHEFVLGPGPLRNLFVVAPATAIVQLVHEPEPELEPEPVLDSSYTVAASVHFQ